MPSRLVFALGACLPFALSGCASDARLADGTVRSTDRVDCQRLRGNSAEVRADPSVSVAAYRECGEDGNLTLWRSEGAGDGQPVDFRRDRGDGEP